MIQLGIAVLPVGDVLRRQQREAAYKASHAFERHHGWYTCSCGARSAYVDSQMDDRSDDDFRQMHTLHRFNAAFS